MDPAIFKAYDIRGVYPDQLDEEAAWKIGYATARFLRSLLRGYQRGQANAQSLCVGRDMRTHSENLAQALIDGMNATGTNVIDIGMIDTPQMYFAINHLGTCGGVQVTASHNPAKYNGFKISGLKATPIGADTGLKDIEHIATALPHTKSTETASIQKRDLTEEYKYHVLKFLDPAIKNLKIAVDASNGMAGKMIPGVFSDLPIEIFPINFEHKGEFTHEPDPLVEKNLADVKRAVKQESCDFGICFDGDADRMMMVDQTGKNISCDLLTALMVPYFLKVNPTATVVYDLRSSWVVPEEIIKYGGTPRRERVGHSFMKKAMRDSRAAFGGELSGHFYYRDNYCTDSAAITLVHMLNIVTEATLPINQLIQPLRRYYQSGEINFKVEDKQEKMDELARRYRDAKIDYLDGVTIQYKDCWFNCRPSNTEPLLRLNVEAKTRELLNEILAEIKEQLTTPT
ncbi:MAG: phosphomannomutase/phosphoglucomutase [Phycisphaerae bacterium]|nr:phosphomannomutase/phosphoglucomutase [Phycisphaerae bacterium]NIP52417.1 phosphomannomutase/phosphoglucomutase [Phycisphaerae bacterium]NIS51410.1 phosphomannomutase/phosphoglucomutase [Phycisphaerae bacterium]NIU09025.1 phosphomannomutase/phosphoglucomutase [Phycisphaerae bacterium]NIU56685.1 phosphomannomutase/phosphoglucomutase [Phycisphaerae bacterium]